MKGRTMEKDKYMVISTGTYVYGTDEYGEKIIKHLPLIYEFFEHLSDARIYANNLPTTEINVRIYELFERYDDEKEEKTELDSFFEEFNKMT